MTVDARTLILDLVRRYPALHLREIERRLSMPDRLAAYHLAALETEGLVRRAKERGYVRYYDAGQAWTTAEKAQARVLRREPAYKIALLLLEAPSVVPTEVAKQIGLSKATVSYYLNRLCEAQIAQARTEGRNRFYSARQPRRLKALLHDLPPPPGSIDEFERLWDDLVG